MANILNTNSLAKVPHYVIVKRINNFSAQKDPAGNKILENLSQTFGTKKMYCYLCQSGEKK